MRVIGDLIEILHAANAPNYDTLRQCAQERKPFPSTAIGEYVGGKNPHLGLAVATINGNYPEKGFVRNDTSDELYYVVSGKGSFSQRPIVKQGDSVYIPHGNWYKIRGEKLKFVIASAPAWRAEQHIFSEPE